MYEYQIRIKTDEVVIMTKWDADQLYVRKCIAELAKAYGMERITVAQRSLEMTIEPAELFGV